MVVLAGGAEITAVAEAVGVGRTTGHRWLREDCAFLAAVNRTKLEMRNAIRLRLETLAERALPLSPVRWTPATCEPPWACSKGWASSLAVHHRSARSMNPRCSEKQRFVRERRKANYGNDICSPSIRAY